MTSPLSRLLLLGAAGAVVASCGGSPGDAGRGTGTPQPAAFDVAAVAMNFRDECKGPDAAILLDATFCQEVRLDSLSGEGTILRVPTINHGAGSVARAAVICRLFARHRFDSARARPLGYESIDILDRDGGTSFSCSVQ